MKDKKIVLIVIIILLCIFLPASIYGTITKVPNKRNNPDQELFYRGYLWFYDEEGNLLSKYKCLTEKCGIAEGIIDDDKYNINYLKDGTYTLDYKNSTFTFITDGEETILYKVKQEGEGKGLVSYKNVKYYKSKLENDVMIVQNENGKWGVISFGESLGSVLPMDYDFVGLKDELNSSNELSTKRFVVLKDNSWSIVDNTGNLLTSPLENPISDYNTNYVVSIKDDKYNIYDYNGNRVFSDGDIYKVVMVDSYMAILYENKMYVYVSDDQNYISSVDINSYDEKTTIKMEDGKLKIIVNGQTVNVIS